MRVAISLGFVVSLRPKGAAFGQAGSTRLDSTLPNVAPRPFGKLEPHCPTTFSSHRYSRDSQPWR